MVEKRDVERVAVSQTRLRLRGQHALATLTNGDRSIPQLGLHYRFRRPTRFASHIEHLLLLTVTRWGIRGQPQSTQLGSASCNSATEIPARRLAVPRTNALSRRW